MSRDWPATVHGLGRALTVAATDTYARLHPEASPTFAEVGSGWAAYCGDGSPLSQVVGIGFGDERVEEALEAAAAFYAGRTSVWEVIVAPWQHPGLLAAAIGQGWRAAQWEQVLGRELDEPPPAPSLDVRLAEGELFAPWSDVSVRAFFGEDAPPWAAELGELMGGSEGSYPLLAFIDGQPAAAAVLAVAGEAAYLGGAATLPEARGRGAQSALLAARLRLAAELGVKALVCEALPGSVSERNQLRAGFRLLWSKVVLTPG